MKLAPKTLLFLLLCIGAATSLSAQNYRLYLGAGVATLRGEVTDEAILREDYGVDYAAQFLYPLPDERFVLTATLSHSQMTVDRQFYFEEGRYDFLNQYSQSYLGLGMRWYLSNEVNKYNVYEGMLLPFVELNFGPTFNRRRTQLTDVNSVIYKTESNSIPSNGYTLVEGNNVDFTGELAVGLVYHFNSAMAFSASAGARPGLDDSWDGIIGASAKRDWLMRSSFGIQYGF